MHLHGKGRFEGETSKSFNVFVRETGATDPAISRALYMEGIAADDNTVQ